MNKVTHKTFCRYCHAYCPMEADVEEGKVTAVRPDTSNEVYGGYTCIKGRQLVEQMYQDARLTKSLTRGDTGEFEEISSEHAIAEIAQRVQDIVAEHGPRAIATYNGTVAFQNSAQLAYSRAFHYALNSPSYYTSVTIDQPAKVFVGSRMGYWGAGGHFFHDSDVAMVIGNNTPVSHFAAPGGVPSVSPFDQIRTARKRGLKLIAIDPRVTELARRADVHLQIKPGQDSTLLAGMIRLILAEDLHDRDFCEQYVEGLEELRKEVEHFDLETVARLTDIPAADIASTARLFAAGPRGGVVTGTGPEMGAHPNLTQQMVGSLNAICGRFYRAGDTLPNPGVLSPASPRRAQVLEVPVAWGQGISCRTRDDLGELTTVGMMGPISEMPTSQLADEILLEGDGQIKALIVVAGNPLLAWPDQIKAHEALKQLDLLICIDPYISATAEMADYVLAPKLTLEREDVTLLSDPWYETPYSQYSKTVLASDHDVIEEWELYWGIARHLGLKVKIGGTVVPNEPKPTKHDLLKIITAGSRVDIDYLRDNPGGHVFEEHKVTVEPAQESAQGTLKLYPEGVKEEFAALRADNEGVDSRSHLLICSRNKYVLNSFGLNLPAIKAKAGTTNPAYVHPDDLKQLNIEDDSEVTIASGHGSITAVVRANDNIKPGVIAMNHSWGTAPGKDLPVREVGANTNRLVNGQDGLQKFTGMTRQSAIPVSITALAAN